MYPLIGKLGPVPIHSYGLLIAIGFLFALLVIRRLSIRERLDPDRMFDVTFWSLLVGFVGARLLFILTRLGDFAADPAEIFRVWNGGLVFFGGPLAVLPFCVWYLRRHRISFWKAADVMIPGLVLNHAFGRLGCIAAGCCYGRPTGSDFGFKFYSELVEPALRGIPLHPTQLYESVALFLLFGGLLWVSRRKVFDGQVGLTYFIAYPIIRSVIEIFRGDLIRGYVIDGILSTSQFISILVFIGATVALRLRLKAVAQRSQTHA